MWIADKIEDMIDDAKMRAGSKKKPMTGFSYSYGGNMCGNSHRESVMPVDNEHARISISHADWHYQNPEVNEYLTDIAVMKKLEEVFHKHSMEKWNGKKFTDMFVCDGESYSYSFDFDKAWIGFSSQIYPRKYHDKLNELHEIVKEYIGSGKKLPHLVTKNVEAEESYRRYKPDDGKIGIEVFKYCEGRLYYLVSNGTGEKHEYDRSIKIYKDEESGPFFTKEKNYRGTVYQNSADEQSIDVPGILTVGIYRLEVGACSCGFEIAE